jgi:hypothetical protein
MPTVITQTPLNPPGKPERIVLCTPRCRQEYLADLNVPRDQKKYRQADPWTAGQATVRVARSGATVLVKWKGSSTLAGCDLCGLEPAGSPSRRRPETPEIPYKVATSSPEPAEPGRKRVTGRSS